MPPIRIKILELNVVVILDEKKPGFMNKEEQFN